MINQKTHWLVLVNCHQMIILIQTISILLPQIQMMANQNQLLLEKHHDFFVKYQMVNRVHYDHEYDDKTKKLSLDATDYFLISLGIKNLLKKKKIKL